MTELEREVLEIINCEIEGCYIGKLEVKEDRFYHNFSCSTCSPNKKLYNIEYSLNLYLNADYEPIIMSYMYRRRNFNPKTGWEQEASYLHEAQKAFKEFIKEEFKNRMLQQVDYYKLTLQLPSIDCSNE